MSRIDDNEKELQELIEEIESLEAEITEGARRLAAGLDFTSSWEVIWHREYLDGLNRRLDYLNNEELVPLLDKMEENES